MQGKLIPAKMENVYQSWQCRGVAAGRGWGEADASRLAHHAGDGCNNFIVGVRVVELFSVLLKFGVA